MTWSVLTWNCRRTNRGTLWHSICLLCDHCPSPSALITNRCQPYPHTPSRSDGLRSKMWSVMLLYFFLVIFLPASRAARVDFARSRIVSGFLYPSCTFGIANIACLLHWRFVCCRNWPLPHLLPLTLGLDRQKQEHPANPKSATIKPCNPQSRRSRRSHRGEPLHLSDDARCHRLHLGSTIRVKENGFRLPVLQLWPCSGTSCDGGLQAVRRKDLLDGTYGSTHLRGRRIGTSSPHQ